MKALTLDELRELAPAYVMGTLSLEETRAFDIALRDPALAAELQPEIDAHRDAFEFLASAHAVTPPAALKDRVMQRIAPPRASRAGWWAAGAGAVAFAASMLFAVEQRTRVRALESELASESARASQADSALAERERTLAALLDGGNDLTLVRLTANAPADGPGLQVFWNTREGRAIVNATGLEPVAADRAYCLWIIQNGTPVPVKLFQVDASGRALVKDVILPTDLAGIAAFALTEEPATGSAQPTMTPFLVGAVPPKG